MPTTVNTHEAKTHLSRLLVRAAAGEEIVIVKAGHPIDELVAYQPAQKPRRFGELVGKIRMADSAVADSVKFSPSGPDHRIRGRSAAGGPGRRWLRAA